MSEGLQIELPLDNDAHLAASTQPSFASPDIYEIAAAILGNQE